MVKDLASVVIVSCNRKDYLEQCLNSVQAQVYSPLEIILVNNCSDDNAVNWLKQNHPDIEIIANKENMLFCVAHNQGIRVARGEYILCLNDDVILEKNFVQELVKNAGKDNSIGMVSGKILRFDKKTIDSTGLFLSRSRRPYERGFNQIDKRQYEKTEYIFGVSGAVGFYRRDMLEDIKIGDDYFDSDYGIFYDDLDLCWRANRFGWKGYYAPGAIAYHLRGGTVKENNPRISFLKRYNFAYLPLNLQAHLMKNRYMTIIKNDSLRALILNISPVAWYEIKLWSYALFFKPRLIWETIKNAQYFLKALGKRKSIQERKTLV